MLAAWEAGGRGVRAASLRADNRPDVGAAATVQSACIAVDKPGAEVCGSAASA